MDTSPKAVVSSWMPKRGRKGNLMIKFIENGNKNEIVRNVIKTSLEHKKIPSVETDRTLNVAGTGIEPVFAP